MYRYGSYGNLKLECIRIAHGAGRARTETWTPRFAPSLGALLFIEYNSNLIIPQFKGLDGDLWDCRTSAICAILLFYYFYFFQGRSVEVLPESWRAVDRAGVRKELGNVGMEPGLQTYLPLGLWPNSGASHTAEGLQNHAKLYNICQPLWYVLLQPL